MEFRAALYAMIQEKKPKLILITYGDIGPINNLQPEIRSYMKTTTYLTSDERWFWKKLSYSLRRPKTIQEENYELDEREIEMQEVS